MEALGVRERKKKKKKNFGIDVIDSGRLIVEDEEGCGYLQSGEATCVWRLCHLEGMER